MAPQFAEEELEGLSEEELEALKDEDLEVEDPEKDAEEDDSEEEAADPEEEDDSEEEAEEGDDDPEDKGEPEEEDEEEPEEEDDSEEEKEEPVIDDTPDFTPELQVEAVEDFDGKMKAIVDQKKDLRKQFQDGDLELDEYEEKRDELDGQAMDLRERNLKSTMAAENNKQTKQQKWEWAQERFFEDPKNAIYDEDPMFMGAIDAKVKELAADEKNAKRSMFWFLREADRQVRGKFNIPSEDKETKDDDGDKDTKKKEIKKTSKKKADRSKVPPNLGDLPSAEQPETGDDGEFSHLDKLEGMELEEAVAKLTPEQSERWLKGQ